MIATPEFVKHRSAAFTLIELSIVLVIIGLIVGGVLVGKDLIEASKIRATASQLQQISAAVTTFKLKYDALPGDMLKTDAQKFGLRYSPNSSKATDNNGNFKCYDPIWCPGGPLDFWITAEVSHFFIQLADAKLIDGSYSWFLDSGRTTTNAGVDFPALKMDLASGMLPFTSNLGGNWLALNCNTGPMQWLIQTCSVTYTSTDTGFSHLPNLRFIPQRSFALDSKIDDGKPGQGILRAIKNLGNQDAIDNFAGVCVTDTSSTAYNVTNTQNVCSLAYKF